MTTQILGNKGDWSEFYAFLKILELKKLPSANEKLEAEENKFIHFRKIHRLDQHDNEIIYDLSGDEIQIHENRNDITIIKNEEITSKIQTIFKKIIDGPGSERKGSFCIEEAELLASLLLCHSIKAPSSQKSDIVATILDQVTHIEERSGFSVKSMTGSASTLLNAGETTNFEYLIKGLNKEHIQKINSIDSRSKIQERVKEIIKQGGEIVFCKLQNNIFEKNLRKIDTMMPEFIAETLVYSSHNKDRSLIKLATFLSEHNKFSKFDFTKDDYKFKLQQLLIASALGMVPATSWDGMMKARGGYIVVKSEGDIVCYHAFNRDLFLEYLFNNTRFEAASTKRYKYGELYEEHDQIKLKLNLQIRFK